MSYVYRKTEQRLWTVGYYDPDGHWEPESDFDSPKAAAQRTAWLNGSNNTAAARQRERECNDLNVDHYEPPR